MHVPWSCGWPATVVRAHGFCSIVTSAADTCSARAAARRKREALAAQARLTPQQHVTPRLGVLRQEVLRKRHAELLRGATLTLLLRHVIHLHGAHSSAGASVGCGAGCGAAARTVFLTVSVAVMSLLSPRRYAGAMSLSSSTSHCHSTAWCTFPSRHTRATRTRDLPCACLARCMAAAESLVGEGRARLRARAGRTRDAAVGHASECGRGLALPRQQGSQARAPKPSTCGAYEYYSGRASRAGLACR